jgi:parallel beta-helix repeat protein
MHKSKSYLFLKATGFFLAVVLFFTTSVKEGFGQTIVEVGGEIESQEWTSDHVYHVTSHLVVNVGVELIIRSGVSVKFMQGTGMTVNGSLKVLGQENGVVDTVFFQPLYVNPPFNWKWLGIQINRVQVPNTNIIDHARIENAFTGITISGDSRNVSVKNTVVHNSQLFGIVISSSSIISIESCKIQYNTGAGINIQNSGDCIITNNYISDNYDGIWLLASEAGNKSTGNSIAGNVIRNSSYTNIFLNNVDGGKCTGNIIESNFIESSFIGIQLGSPSSSSGRNIITGNVIITDKISGSGVIVFQDTAVINQNIFWQNKDAVILNRANYCEITNNSFYDNGLLGNGTGITINPGSSHTQITYNTFTGNGNFLIDLREASGPIVSNNNFFKNRRTSGLIRNNTGSVLPMQNNYWGTSDTAAIELMVAGNFIYSPFLTSPDTIAPVSPPMPAYKQVIDNKVKVSWTPNPEEDLGGYRIHFGAFKYYSFEDFVDAGTDTIILLDIAGIYDTIAITAYDTNGELNNAQLLGHESPFSFPVIIPYAGPDTSICKDQTEFFITQSTYFGNYINLNWSTSGDGSFSSGNELWTVYYPGQNDLDSGSVKLTLYVLVDIGVIYEDSFILSFLDFPVAYAGNDTILSADSSLHLHLAYANHFDTLFWSSTGNGVFDDPGSMNPVYTPGEEDISNGSAQLVLHAVSRCGSATDTLNIIIERRYRLEGRVWKDDQPLSDGIVLAISAKPGDYKAKKITPVLNDGVFRFINLVAGNYILYAVPDTLIHPETLPGYYVNRSHWKDAYQLDLQANTFDLDLRLATRMNQLPAGVGRISGHFINPLQAIPDQDIYCSDWFGEPDLDLLNCQDGLSNVTILLLSKSGNKILSHKLSDASGNFLFDHLPFGDYIIDAEKAGYYTTLSPVLTLSPQNPEIDDVIITIEPELININAGLQLKFAEKVEVFPNPAGPEIHLPVFHGLDEACTVEIRNVYSQQVIFKQFPMSAITGKSVLRLEVNHLSAGIYFGTIITDAEIRSFTFVKN